MKKIFFLLIVCFGCIGCNNLQYDYSQLIGKQINLDVVNVTSISKFTILFYSRLDDCVTCELQPDKWRLFVREIKGLDVSVIILLHPPKDVYKNLTSFYSDLPIIYDFDDLFFNNNDIHKDRRFHCYLLDENNRVILIGNPVQNPKIKELYLRTICERLGIEYNQNSDAKMDSKNEIDLGSFPKSESKSVQFFIPNNTESEMQIDTVFTSCECITAKIDKISISPHQNASLSVTYTPDGSGEFFREVYVKVRGEDKPKTFAIRGNVE